MGRALTHHPDPSPRSWKDEVAQRSLALQESAIVASDWPLADAIARSAATWDAVDEEELDARLASVKTAHLAAVEEDKARLLAVLERIKVGEERGSPRRAEGEREKKHGALLEGEVAERALRLARSTGPELTREAIRLLAAAEIPARRREFLIELIGRKGDVTTGAGEHTGLSLVTAALAGALGTVDPTKSDEIAAWMRAAARLHARSPGTISGLPESIAAVRKAYREFRVVANAAQDAKRLVGLVSGQIAPRIGESTLAADLDELAAYVTGTVRAIPEFTRLLVTRESAARQHEPSEIGLAFLYATMGLHSDTIPPDAGDPAPATPSLLAAGFDESYAAMRAKGDRELAADPALLQATTAATALSRMAQAGFATKLHNARNADQASILWERTELAFALIPLVWDSPRTANEWNNRGVARRDQGDLAGAIEDFSRAIAIDPCYAGAYNNRAAARHNQGDLSRAIDDFSCALAIDPNCAAAYNNRGITRHDQGDLAGAIDDWSCAIAIDPNDVDAYNNRGIARSDQGNLVGAIDDFSRAIAIDTNYANAYHSRAIARRDQGDFAGAIDDYSRALAIDPNCANAYNGRAIARRDQGDFAGAIDDFSRALAIDPNFASAYYNRGLARHHQGDVAGAIADYSGAIATQPNYAMAYNNRGVARLLHGDSAGAIDDFSRALAIDPNHAGAHSNRGLARSGRGDLADAIEDYSRAIAIDPSVAQAYNNRGLARSDQGDLPGALDDYSRAIAIDPRDWQAIANRGIAQAALGDRAAAAASFSEALRVAPAEARERIEVSRRQALGD